MIQSRIRSAGGLEDPAQILQNTSLGLKRQILSCLQAHAFDLAALELPQIEQAELLLLRALQLRKLGFDAAHRLIALRDIRRELVQPGERIQHVALRFQGEEKLLVVLAVDIPQVRSQIAEQRYRRRAAGNKSPRFSSH